MHDALKISLTTALAGIAVGVGLQSAADPMLQTIGQGWMLGGVAATALVGGFAAASSAWKSYKQERSLNKQLESLEAVQKSGAPVDAKTISTFLDTARKAGYMFEDARDAKKETVLNRIAALGSGLAQNAQSPEHAQQAVHATLDAMSFRLGQALPTVETKAPTEPAFGSTSPAMA